MSRTIPPMRMPAAAMTDDPNRAGDRPLRPAWPMRRYEVTYLHRLHGIEEFSRLAPAHPVFEDAFGALGHGAILQTEAGPMCVEDLIPGDKIRLANGDYDTLLWRGAMTLDVDEHAADGELASLIRITADALGPQRPSPDLVLGPTARLCHRANGIRTLTGARAAFIPARDFVDGSQFIALRPATPVRVYQLGFADHQRLSVNGIEIESLHPGTAFAMGLRGDLMTQFLGLFPHKRDFDDFGPLKTPRLRLRDLDIFDQ